MKKIIALTLMLTASAALSGLQAEGLRFGGIFTDNAVLQQASDVMIWGWGKPGGAVELECSWSGTGFMCVADEDGYWEFSLRTPEGSYERHAITAADGHNEVTLSDILIGEVWIASGQSNMEVKLAPDPEWNLYVDGADKVMEEDTTSYIRTFNVARDFSFEPLADLRGNSGKWIVADHDNIGSFSAVGFFFAQQIRKHLDVPVGIICSAFGGTPIQSWLPPEISETKPLYSGLAGIRQDQINMERLGTEASKQRMRQWFDDAQLPAMNELGLDVIPANAATVELPGLLQEHIGERYGGSLLYREVFMEEQTEVSLYFPKIDRNARIYWNGELIYENLLPSAAYESPVIDIPSRMVKSGANVLVINLLNYLWNGGLSGEADEFYAQTREVKIPLAGQWTYLPTFDLGEVVPMPFEGRADEFTISSLYNAMISPLIQYRFKGVLWQQGEANVDEADEYPAMLKDLALSWRENNGHRFPFYYVELPPWPYSGGENTEAARMRIKMAEAAEIIPASAMAVTIDAGTYDNIHSPKKRQVGERLGYLALANTYGIPGCWEYPTVRNILMDGENIILEMSGTFGGVTYEGSPLFEISPDGTEYRQVEFELSGNKITLRTEGESVRDVRYNYRNFPTGNIFNSKNLPLDNFVLEIK